MTSRGSRCWCFTIFEQAEEWAEYLGKKPRAEASYMIGQLEQCPKTGEYHVQGYCEYKDAKTMSAVKKVFKCESMHLEEARGSAAQNKAYCSKLRTSVNASTFEHGIAKQQGKRNDMDTLAEYIKAGATVDEICQVFPIMVIKFARNIQFLVDRLKPKELYTDMVVHWRWGRPGTGKTRHVYDTHGVPNIGTASWPWFDGYTGEEVLLFDDVEKEVFYKRDILRYLDIYPVILPIKGGFVKRSCKFIYITSNWDPRDLPQEYLRRLTSITEVKKV